MTAPVRPERPRRRKQQDADPLAALRAAAGETSDAAPSTAASSTPSSTPDPLAALRAAAGETDRRTGAIDLGSSAAPITSAERAQMRRLASVSVPTPAAEGTVSRTPPRRPLPTSTIRPGPARTATAQREVEQGIAERTLGRVQRTRPPEPLRPRLAEQPRRPMTLGDVQARVEAGVAPRDVLRPDPRSVPPAQPTIKALPRPTETNPAALAQLAHETRQQGVYQGDVEAQAIADNLRRQALIQSDRELAGSPFLGEAARSAVRTGTFGILDPQRGADIAREQMLRDGVLDPAALEASGLLPEDERKARPALLGEEGDDLQRMAGGFVGALPAFGPGLLAERAALAGLGRATIGAGRTARIAEQLAGASLPARLARGALEGQGVGALTEGVAARSEGRDVGDAIAEGMEANALLGAGFEGAAALLARAAGRSPRGGAATSRRAPRMPQDAATTADAASGTPAPAGAATTDPDALVWTPEREKELRELARKNGVPVEVMRRQLEEHHEFQLSRAQAGKYRGRDANMKRFAAEEGKAPPAREGDAPAPARAGDVPEGIQRVRVADLAIDPQRFQFKLNVDEQGVGRELKSVEKFNPKLAGIITVWRDPKDGRTYVVNGHHRAELARRTGTEHVNVQYSDAPTAEAARAEGALVNIAEGRGTALDAAKFFRDAGVGPDALRAEGVSLSGAVARNGVALSRLASDVFDRVATGKVHERHGVILGEVLGESPAMQRAAASIIEGAARQPTDAQVYEIAQQVRGAGEAKFTQEGLFGADTIDESLILQRSEVAAELRKRLEGDKRLFGFVTKGQRAETLARGGSTIDVEQSGRLAESAAIFSEAFGREAHSAAPVGRLITDAARRVANGERAKAVAESIYEQVRTALHEALAGRSALRGTGLEARDADAGRLPAGHDAARGQGAGGASAEGAAGAEGLEGRVRDSDDPAQGGMFDPRPGATARELLDSLEPGSLLDDQLGDPNAPLASPSRITRRPSGSGERLEMPAIRLESGEVFEGRHLWQSFDAAAAQGFPLSAIGQEYEIGFVTSTGRFVEEREAVSLAFRAGQLRKNSRLYKALASGVIPIDFKERHVEPHQLKGLGGTAPLARDFPHVGAILPVERQVPSDPRPAEAGTLDSMPPEQRERIEEFMRFYNEGDAPIETGDPDVPILWRAVRARPTPEDKPEPGQLWDAWPVQRFAEGGEKWPYEAPQEGYLYPETGAREPGSPKGWRFITREEAQERFGDKVDIGPEGRNESGALFSPAEGGRRGRSTDLFGDELTEEGDAQGSMFGAREGTESARSLAQAEAAARGELDVLRTRLALETDAAKRTQTAKRIAELERLVNRGKAIGADELRARALAGESGPTAADVPDDFPPPGPDQGVLLSPASNPASALGHQIRKALGVGLAKFDEVKALSSIAKGLAEAVGVPLRQGRGNLTRMRAEGAFWIKPEVIRVRRIRKLDTVAHEVGHYLSLRYGLKEMVKALGRAEARTANAELVQMGKDLYGSRKPAGGYAEEGVAQWARFYVTDPARLQQDAPTFAAFMETALANEPALKGALDTAREAWEAYQAAPAAAKIDAMQAIGHRQAFRPSWRAFVRYALDDLTDIEAEVESLGGADAISKDAYKLARLTRGDAGKALDMAERGVIDFATRQRVSRGLKEILADVGEDRWQELRRFLIAERALEKAAQGVDTGVDTKAALEIAQAGRADPVLWKAAGEVWDYSNALLAYLRDAGLMTPDEWAAIAKNNKRRVPFYRVIDPNETGTLGGGGGGKQLARNSSGLHALKGSDRPIIDPLESLLADTYNIVSTAEKHSAAVALVKQALRTEGGGRVVELLPETPRDRVTIRLVDVADQLSELGFTVPDDLPDEKVQEMAAAVLEAFYPKKRGGLREAQDLVMPILIDGERKWVQIKDRTLWNALVNMETIPRAVWERIMEAPNRLLRAGATLSPDFIGTNPIRDAFTTSIYSQAPGMRPPGAHLAEGVFHLFKKDALYQRWLQEGGMNAGLVGFDQRAVQSALDEMKTGKWSKVFRPVTNPIRSLAAVAEFMENSNRLGEFAAVYRDRTRKGMRELDAAKEGAFASRELLDFARAGVAGRWANRLIAFVNANVQDLDKLRREMLFSDPARRLQVLARATAYLTVPSVMLHLAQMEDEAYQDIPEAVKATGWVWVSRGEDGEVDRIWWIPRPHILGVLFGYLPTKVMDYIAFHDPTSLRQAAEGVALVATPPWMPTFAKPLYDIARNKDFRDRPIVPKALEGLEAPMQAQRWTGETARLLGEWTGTSPAQLEYLVQGYTGGLGRYATDIADAAVREGRELAGRPPLKPRDLSRPDKLDAVPLVGRFVQPEPGSDAQSVREVYDAYQAAEEKRRTWRRLLRDGKSAEATRYLERHREEIGLVATGEETGGERGPLRQFREAFDEINAAKRAVYSSPMTDAAKQERIRALDDRLIDLAHRYLNRFRRVPAGLPPLSNLLPGGQHAPGMTVSASDDLVARYGPLNGPLTRSVGQ